MNGRVLRWVLCGIALEALALACQPSPEIALCDELPDATACPLTRGGTCDDPECSALYDCVEGKWELVKECDPVVATGGGGAGGGGAGEGGCVEVSIDTDSPAIGCRPDLQTPDCPVEAAASCQPCLTGCVDFFSCETEGWSLVAFCAEDGSFVAQP